MIKINLLNEPQNPAAQDVAQDEPVKVKAPRGFSAGAAKGACLPIVGILVFMLFAGAGVAYYYWLVKSDRDGGLKKQRELNESLIEKKKQLEPFIGLEEGQVRAQSEAMNKKVEILANLQKQQQIPVSFWTDLENSVPENMSLLRLTQKGPKVEIKGESLNDDAIYQFRDALEKSRMFSNVNIGSQSRRGSFVEFGISLDLVNP